MIEMIELTQNKKSGISNQKKPTPHVRCSSGHNSSRPWPSAGRWILVVAVSAKKEESWLAA